MNAYGQAYSTPIANLGKVISAFENKGFTVVSSFDTREEIGVFTEITGITRKGEIAVQEMRIGLGQE